jgi:iron complex outermembrane receptor protein
MSWNKTISRSNAPANATKRTSTSYFNIDWILVAAQKRTDRNELPTPGYNLLQSQAGWSIPVDDHRTLTIRLQAQNLLNRPYLNHLSRYRLIQLPEPGRNLQVIVSLQF